MQRGSKTLLGKAEMKQTDEEFVVACGFSGDAEAGKTAVDLRRRLAEYGKVKSDTLGGTSRIIDTGLIHPFDSIDLIEFTCQMEDILGESLTEADFQSMADAGAEEMQIRQWVQLVVEIRKRKRGTIPC